MIKRERERSVEAFKAKFKPPPLATHILSQEMPEVHSLLTQYDLLGSGHEQPANSSRSCGSHSGSYARSHLKFMQTSRLALHASDIISSAPSASKSTSQFTPSAFKLEFEVRSKDRTGSEGKDRTGSEGKDRTGSEGKLGEDQLQEEGSSTTTKAVSSSQSSKKNHQERLKGLTSRRPQHNPTTADVDAWQHKPEWMNISDNVEINSMIPDLDERSRATDFETFVASIPHPGESTSASTMLRSFQEHSRKQMDDLVPFVSPLRFRNVALSRRLEFGIAQDFVTLKVANEQSNKDVHEHQKTIDDGVKKLLAEHESHPKRMARHMTEVHRSVSLAPLHLHEGFSLDVNQSNPRVHRDMRGAVLADSPGSLRNMVRLKTDLQQIISPNFLGLNVSSLQKGRAGRAGDARTL